MRESGYMASAVRKALTANINNRMEETKKREKRTGMVFTLACHTLWAIRRPT